MLYFVFFALFEFMHPIYIKTDINETFFPLILAERECHTNLDCDHLNPCISHFPILHAMNRVMDDQFFVGMKKECFDAFDPTVGGNAT